LCSPYYYTDRLFFLQEWGCESGKVNSEDDIMFSLSGVESKHFTKLMEDLAVRPCEMLFELSVKLGDYMYLAAVNK
jgi:hypothetical protein